MTNVYDIDTGLLIEQPEYIPSSTGVEEITDILRMRKDQIVDMAVVWREADGSIKCGWSLTDDMTLLGMAHYLSSRLSYDYKGD